jgi:hypothetical protein
MLCLCRNVPRLDEAPTKMKSRPEAAVHAAEFGLANEAAAGQLPMRAVPERPSLRTQFTLAPSRVRR